MSVGSWLVDPFVPRNFKNPLILSPLLSNELLCRFWKFMTMGLQQWKSALLINTSSKTKTDSYQSIFLERAKQKGSDCNASQLSWRQRDIPEGALERAFTAGVTWFSLWWRSSFLAEELSWRHFPFRFLSHLKKKIFPHGLFLSLWRCWNYQWDDFETLPGGLFCLLKPNDIRIGVHKLLFWSCTQPLLKSHNLPSHPLLKPCKLSISYATAP